MSILAWLCSRRRSELFSFLGCLFVLLHGSNVAIWGQHSCASRDSVGSNLYLIQAKCRQRTQLPKLRGNDVDGILKNDKNESKSFAHLLGFRASLGPTGPCLSDLPHKCLVIEPSRGECQRCQDNLDLQNQCVLFKNYASNDITSCICFCG